MQLKNKWVITTDSICEGVTADKDEQGHIILYQSEAEAAREVMDCLFMWAETNNANMAYQAQEYGEYDEDLYFMPAKGMEEMQKLSQEGTAEQIDAFYGKHPNMDTRDMGWEPAEDFVEGHKAIWTGNGGHIEGTPIKDMEVTKNDRS